MGMAPLRDQSQDSSSVYIPLDFPISASVNEIRVAVADFKASVGTYTENRNILRRVKYTWCMSSGRYLPTYHLLEGFDHRPFPPAQRHLRLDRDRFLRRTSRSLCPRARSTRRLRQRGYGVVSRTPWREPPKRIRTC